MDRWSRTSGDDERLNTDLSVESLLGACSPLGEPRRGFELNSGNLGALSRHFGDL